MPNVNNWRKAEGIIREARDSEEGLCPANEKPLRKYMRKAGITLEHIGSSGEEFMRLRHKFEVWWFKRTSVQHWVNLGYIPSSSVQHFLNSLTKLNLQLTDIGLTDESFKELCRQGHVAECKHVLEQARKEEWGLLYQRGLEMLRYAADHGLTLDDIGTTEQEISELKGKFGQWFERYHGRPFSEEG